MKKMLFVLVVVLTVFAFAACTAQPPVEVNSTDSEFGSSAAQSLSEEPSGEISEQDEPTEEKIYVADAAQYRGTVTKVESTADRTIVTLVQVPGTDFGAESVDFRFTADTRTSFEMDQLLEGVYAEVFYGSTAGMPIDTSKPVDAIGANIYPPADMVIFNGVLKEIMLNPEKEGAGRLVMEELTTKNVVEFNFDQENTQFYLNFDELKPGDKLNIFHRGIFTMSIPPQGLALEVRLYAEPKAE